MVESQKMISQGEICLNISAHANKKGGHDQISGWVSIL